eukprot:TRINITY_DN50932_c0_g1_i1.p1 TRINITY_DN50932_c0_g1~~TRINITY_DN50932_c0_g1_i1.p1  ORF type:complete len:423 (-),score=44.20 TRINITY_DN50932_c0_g1_i1:126-1394(-)
MLPPLLVTLCWRLATFLSVWFVLLRTQAIVPLFSTATLFIQRIISPSWVSKHPDADCAHPLVRATLFVHEQGDPLVCKVVLALASLPMCWGIIGKACVVFVPCALLFDTFRLVLGHGDSRASERESHLNNGVTLDPPPRSQTEAPEWPQKWIVFEGGLGLAFFYMGMIHVLVERYGKKELGVLGFAGASSGGWSAGYSCAPLHSPYDVKHWALGQMHFALDFCQLLPFGMIFSVPLAIKHSGMWGMRTAWKFPSCRQAFGDGKYLMWLTHFTLRPGRRVSRSVVQCGVQKVGDFGDACAACGLLPGMSPCLSWPTQHGLALDGFLYGPGLSPPLLEDSTVTPGRRLVFGFMKERQHDTDMRYLNLRNWRSFSLFRDNLLGGCFSTESHAERLFDLGEADAREHIEELDKAFAEIFGIKPLQQ